MQKTKILWWYINILEIFEFIGIQTVDVFMNNIKGIFRLIGFVEWLRKILMDIH